MLRDHHYRLLLVGEHQGHPRIERKSFTHHEARDGDGHYPDRLVRVHSSGSPLALAAVALSAQFALDRGLFGLAGTQFTAAHVRHYCDLHRAGPLGSGHERRRISRAGLSRN